MNQSRIYHGGGSGKGGAGFPSDTFTWLTHRELLNPDDFTPKPGSGPSLITRTLPAASYLRAFSFATPNPGFNKEISITLPYPEFSTLAVGASSGINVYMWYFYDTNLGPQSVDFEINAYHTSKDRSLDYTHDWLTEIHFTGNVVDSNLNILKMMSALDINVYNPSGGIPTNDSCLTLYIRRNEDLDTYDASIYTSIFCVEFPLIK